MNATRRSSRSTLLASTIAVPLLGACNAMPSTTIDGHDAFERHALRIDLASTSSAEVLARCFEESARIACRSRSASRLFVESFATPNGCVATEQGMPLMRIASKTSPDPAALLRYATAASSEPERI